MNDKSPTRSLNHCNKGTGSPCRRGKVWGQRVATPEDTLNRIRPHFISAGITRIADVTGLDRIGIPVMMVMRPNGRSVAVSAGKGLTTEAARVSGAMEAVESFHAENIILPLLFGHAAELTQQRVFDDFSALPLISGRGDPGDEPLVWIAASDLLSGVKALIPFELVSANFSRPRLPGFGLFLQSTNGVASGNCTEEAILHAVCEVVERDCLALWRRHDGPSRNHARVDPESIDDPDSNSLLQILADAGFSVAIWETTSEIGIPCFHVAILDEIDTAGHHGTGDGCHPDRATAMVRALTEAVQVRLTYISGARDDIARFDYARSRRLQTLGRLRREIAMSKTRGAISFRDVPSHASNDVADDLDRVLDLLREGEVSHVFHVDLSRPDFGIPVSRIVVPGLLGPEDFAHEVATPRTTGRLRALS